MSEKRYCFIPETYKVVDVYNTGTIFDVNALNTISSAIKFKYCNDEYERAKMFFIEGRSSEHSEDDEEYFKYKTLQSIKALFRITDVFDYKIVMDENARIEFTIFYDPDGVHIPTALVVEKNKRNTILAHRYTYIFYKRYN